MLTRREGSRWDLISVGQGKEALDAELSHQVVTLCSDWLADDLASAFDHLGDDVERHGDLGDGAA